MKKRTCQVNRSAKYKAGDTVLYKGDTCIYMLNYVSPIGDIRHMVSDRNGTVHHELYGSSLTKLPVLQTED